MLSRPTLINVLLDFIFSLPPPITIASYDVFSCFTPELLLYPLARSFNIFRVNGSQLKNVDYSVIDWNWNFKEEKTYM